MYVYSEKNFNSCLLVFIATRLSIAKPKQVPLRIAGSP